jgi:hypothetical protein
MERLQSVLQMKGKAVMWVHQVLLQARPQLKVHPYLQILNLHPTSQIQHRAMTSRHKVLLKNRPWLMLVPRPVLHHRKATLLIRRLPIEAHYGLLQVPFQQWTLP